MPKNDSSTSTPLVSKQHSFHNKHSSSSGASPPKPRGRPPLKYDESLPRSVRYAPAELRPIIRRRQNNESAKRCRERERAQMEAIERKYEENQHRIAQLERAVDALSSELTGTMSDGASTSDIR